MLFHSRMLVLINNSNNHRMRRNKHQVNNIIQFLVFSSFFFRGPRGNFLGLTYPVAGGLILVYCYIYMVCKIFLSGRKYTIRMAPGAFCNTIWSLEGIHTINFGHYKSSLSADSLNFTF